MPEKLLIDEFYALPLLGVLNRNWLWVVWWIKVINRFLIFFSFADTWGRKKTILSASTVFCVGSVVMGVATNKELLLIGRIIVGVGVGKLRILLWIFLGEGREPFIGRGDNLFPRCALIRGMLETSNADRWNARTWQLTHPSLWGSLGDGVKRIYGTSCRKSIDRSNFFQTAVILERNKIRQKSDNQIDRRLEDITISFRAFLTYLSAFQSYRGFKKIGAVDTSLTASTF